MTSGNLKRINSIKILRQLAQDDLAISARSLMIVWDFNVIVALGITLSLGVVIVLWVFYTLSRGPINRTPTGRAEPLSNREFFRQCGFCGYLYFDYFKKVPGHCPRCGSYQSS